MQQAFFKYPIVLRLLSIVLFTPFCLSFGASSGAHPWHLIKRFLYADQRSVCALILSPFIPPYLCHLSSLPRSFFTFRLSSSRPRSFLFFYFAVVWVRRDSALKCQTADGLFSRPDKEGWQRPDRGMTKKKNTAKSHNALSSSKLGCWIIQPPSRMCAMLALQLLRKQILNTMPASSSYNGVRDNLKEGDYFSVLEF